MEKNHHISVLANEVVASLNLRQGLCYVDCTFGAGGYTKLMLDTCDCKVIAIDRDDIVKETAEIFKIKYKDRFEFVSDKFSNIADVLSSLNVEKVSGIVCDLGVSSMQLDNADKGFSFNKEGPLSMEMGINEVSAYDVVNTYEENEIADIIYKYGEERLSRRIARAIVNKRKEKEIETTLELADIVTKCMPSKGKIHPATRTFQALRIYVNQELQEVEELLTNSLTLLENGGRLAMVSFHSLEDRIVKNFFNLKSGKDNGVSRYLPKLVENNADLKIITRKPVIASDDEILANPRSRSAKLRVAEKL